MEEKIFSVLTDIRDSLKRIDDSLIRLNGRIRRSEVEITKIKTVGTVAVFLIGIALSMLNLMK